MPSIADILEEMKEAYRRVTGGEPPATSSGGPPFPPGVDPAALVMAEVEAVRSLTSATPVSGATWTPSSPPPAAPPAVAWAPPEAAWAPLADAWMGGGELVLAFDLPGCRPSDLRVRLSPGCVEVAGIRRDEEAGTRTWCGRERPAGPLVRRLPLPGDADLAEASARLAAGVLEVRIRMGAAAAAAAGPAREVAVEG